jgi:hypothetical protein
VEEWYTERRRYLQSHVTAACAGGCLVLSRSLSAIVNEKNLGTLELLKDHLRIAEKACNFLAYRMYYAVKDFAIINDNWRLPPIPQIKSLTKIMVPAKKNFPR